jgi:hypothetical protein
MNRQNYCLIEKNKIYGEIYDNLLDEDLSMFNKDHSDSIKYLIEKLIKNSKYISLSENIENRDDVMPDLIEKITSTIQNENLQGNTILLYATINEMYELFHMDDLTSKISEDELNEFGVMSNIHLMPVYWSCGILKSTYYSDKIILSEINKKDIINIIIKNYYHIGVLIDTNDNLLEIEFTDEEPLRVIGTNFKRLSVYNIIGFNFVVYIDDSAVINKKASIILNKEIKGRMFLSLLCPSTQKKLWDIDTKTIENIITVLSNKELNIKIEKELEVENVNINPFYLLTKTLYSL